VFRAPRIAQKAAAALAGTMALGALLAAYSWLVEPRWLRRRMLRITLPDLPPRLAGARLAFLTDFHLGGPGSAERLTRAAIRAARDWQAELVLLGGDYFDQGIFRPTDTFDDLRELPAVYGVLGNHDYRQSEAAAERITRFLEERGVVMLRNQAVDLRLRGETIRLIGLDDPYTGRAALPPCLTGSPSTTPSTILLAHAPLIVDRLPSGVAHLVLSGHTHAGQICLSPWSRLTPLDAAWYLDRSRGRPPRASSAASTGSAGHCSTSVPASAPRHCLSASWHPPRSCLSSWRLNRPTRQDPATTPRATCAGWHT
jgi:predicted MPP superfamily phosphohydrolase